MEKNTLRNKMTIGIHPGSSELKSLISKRWPIDNFNKLAKVLVKKYGYNVLFFLGPNEEELEENITKNKIIKSNVKNLYKNNDFLRKYSTKDFYVTQEHIKKSLDIFAICKK